MIDRMIEKLRALGEKVIPLAIIGILGYGGWQFHKAGTFRHGIKPAISQIVGKIPYFGSRFRPYLTDFSRSSIAKRGAAPSQIKKTSRRGHLRQGKQNAHRVRRKHSRGYR